MSVISLSSGDEEDCFIVESEDEGTSLNQVFIVENFTPQVGDRRFQQNPNILLDSYKDTNVEDRHHSLETIVPHIGDGNDSLIISYELEPNICPSVPDNNLEVVIVPCHNSDEIRNTTSSHVMEVNSNINTDSTVEGNLSAEAEVEGIVTKCDNFENILLINTQRAEPQSQLQRLAKLLATALTNSDSPKSPSVNNDHLNIPRSSSNTLLEVPKRKTVSNLEKTILEVSKGTFSFGTDLEEHKTMSTFLSCSTSNIRRRRKCRKSSRERGRRRSSRLHAINVNYGIYGIDANIPIQNISFQNEGFAENANLVPKELNISKQTDTNRIVENLVNNNNVFSFPKSVTHDINAETDIKGCKTFKTKRGRKRGINKYSKIETAEVFDKHDSEPGNKKCRRKKTKKKTSIISRETMGSDECLSEMIKKQSTVSIVTIPSGSADTEELFDVRTITTNTTPGIINSVGNASTMQTRTIREDMNPPSPVENGSTHDKELQSIIENLSADIYASLVSPNSPLKNKIIQDNKDLSSSMSSKALVYSNPSTGKSEPSVSNGRKSDEVSLEKITDRRSQFEEENTSLVTENANSYLSADELSHLRKNFDKCYGIIFNENVEQICMKMGDILLLSLKECHNFKTRVTKATKLTCENLKNEEISIALVCYKNVLEKYKDNFTILFVEIHNSIFKNKVIAKDYPEQYKALLLAWFLKLILRLTSVSHEFSDCIEEVKLNITTSLLDDKILQLPFVRDVFICNASEFETACWLVLGLMKDCTHANRERDNQQCPGNIENTEETSSSTISASDSTLSSDDHLHLEHPNLSKEKDLSNLIDHSPDNIKKDFAVRFKQLAQRLDAEGSNLKRNEDPVAGEKILVNNQLVIPKINVSHHLDPQHPLTQVKYSKNKETEGFDIQVKSVHRDQMLVNNGLFPSHLETFNEKLSFNKDGKVSKDMTNTTGKSETFQSVIRSTTEEASKNDERTSLAQDRPIPSTLETLRNKQDQAHLHVPKTCVSLESSSNRGSQSSLTVETCRNNNDNPQFYTAANYSTTGTSRKHSSTTQPKVRVSYAIVQPLNHTEGASYDHTQESQAAFVVSRDNQSISNGNVPADHSAQNSVGTPCGTQKTYTPNNTLKCTPTGLVQRKVPFIHKPQLLHHRVLDSVSQSQNQHCVTKTDATRAFSNNDIINSEIIRNQPQNIHPHRLYQNESQGEPRVILAPNSYTPMASTQCLPNVHNERLRNSMPNENIGRLQSQTPFNSYQHPVNKRSSEHLYYRPQPTYIQSLGNRAVNVYQSVNQQNVAHYNILHQQSYTNRMDDSHHLINPTYNAHQNMSYPQYVNGLMNRVVESSQIAVPMDLTHNKTGGSAVTINHYNINMHNPLGYSSQLNYPSNERAHSVVTANTFRQVVPTAQNLPSTGTVTYVDTSTAQQIISLQPYNNDVMQQMTNTNVLNSRMN